VDLCDDLRLRDRQQVVVALHVAGPVLEPLAAISGLVGSIALDRRTHGPVEDEDSLGHERGELVGRVRAEIDSGGGE